MNRLRSLRCVVNGEWVGSPRRLAYAHVVSDKSEIGEGGKRHPEAFHCNQEDTGEVSRTLANRRTRTGLWI